MNSSKPLDVALIGGGIMSATLGVLIKYLQPDWSVRVFERLGEIGTESSNPWNNAGTGHAALCELNYMPEAPDGSLDPAKAVSINELFQVSRQFWAYLVDQGELPDPSSFINSTPHMTFVQGEANVDYLRRRFEVLRNQPLFHGMEFSEDPGQIGEWTPLITARRPKGQKIAATRITSGTDIDFGVLTKELFSILTARGAVLDLNHEVRSVKRGRDGLWNLKLHRTVGRTPSRVRARFVFVGAGGGALSLLQKARIPEIKGFGGFPISGEFFRTTNPTVVAQHDAKVYGKASVGAPPMSVPHLDARIVEGEKSLLFGPYAGFSPKFLKSGSIFDLPSSIRFHNFGPMLAVGWHNFSLIKYLLSEVFAGRKKRMAALRQFVPAAKDEDWELITAGQRVQVMKKDAEKGGVLQFGTEVVTGADGSIAGLLGASPGASTAVPIMLQVLDRCFPDRMDGWRPIIQTMIPSYGTVLSDDPQRAADSLAATAAALKLSNP